jgi:hypothetical protein
MSFVRFLLSTDNIKMFELFFLTRLKIFFLQTFSAQISIDVTDRGLQYQNSLRTVRQ